MIGLPQNIMKLVSKSTPPQAPGPLPRGRLFLLALCLSLLGIAPSKADLTYVRSAVGNSFVQSIDGTHVQDNMDTLWVKPDGTCYAGCGWDEDKHEVSAYKSGAYVTFFANMHPGEGGNYPAAITGDASYVYIGNGNNIRRYNFDGSHAKFTGGVGAWTDEADPTAAFTGVANKVIVGVAADPVNKRLFAAVNYQLKDSSGNVTGSYSKVFSFNTTSGIAPLSSWDVVRPDRCAVAPDGSLWIIQEGDANNAPAIVRYSSSGSLLTQKITFPSTSWPAALCLDATGAKLYVADNGPDQQVKIFTNLTATPLSAGAFGTLGGIFSGTPGVVAPLKFNGLTGVGLDTNGNIYVSQNRFGPDVSGPEGGGSILESYNLSTSAQNWRLLGLEFVDMLAIDYNGDGVDVYSKYTHYTMDYTQPPNHEWTYKGHMLNRFKYPSDTRYTERYDSFDWSTGYLFRTIQGKKFFFDSSLWGDRFEVYRFNSTTDGEVAIPCALAPIGGHTMWVDDTGNEWIRYKDSSGHQFIRTYPLQGLDANGAPIWNTSIKTDVAAPAPITDIFRVFYYPSTDTLYVCGYSPTLDPGHYWNGPSYNDKDLGSVIARYDHWSQGNRTATWAVVLPDYSRGPLGISIAGNYIFIGYDGVPYQPDDGYIRVLRTSDGGLYGKFLPLPNQNGRDDICYCVNAIQRSTGEYIVFGEDDGNAKVQMYRWTPPTSAPTAPVLNVSAGNTVAVLSWSAPASFGSYSVSRATSASGPFTRVAYELQGTSYVDSGLIDGTLYYYLVAATGPTGDANSNIVSTTPSGSAALKINCGGGSIQDWVNDIYGSGGTTFASTVAVDTTGVANAAPMGVYQTVRKETSNYTIKNLPTAKQYTIRLHFDEPTFNAAGKRQFNVAINGTQVLQNLDIYAETGGMYKALVKQVTGTTDATGKLSFDFTVGAADQPRISGIELVGPPPVTIFETESLAATWTSGVTHRIITGSGFSGGTGTILDATAVGQEVTYTVPAVSAGNYDVKIGMKKFSSRGIYQLSIASALVGAFSNVGSPQDEYATGEVYTEVDLGAWSPASTSDKLFQFTVTGKNASSAGYPISFDYIKLTPQ